MAGITVHKRNHLGEVVWQYEGTVVDRGLNWVCLTALFNVSEADLGFVVFRQGDVFTEWFYADRWYNVFRVEDGTSGELKGWYCNITRPAILAADGVWADDLALDIYVMPNGSVILLDEAEFDALNLPVDERIAALRAVESIRLDVRKRVPPFEGIRVDTGKLRG
jgi:protein associated with RNAse G/E